MEDGGLYLGGAAVCVTTFGGGLWVSESVLDDGVTTLVGGVGLQWFGASAISSLSGVGEGSLAVVAIGRSTILSELGR